MRGRKIILPMVVVILWTLSFSPAKADWTYTVRRGDTLYSIARANGISLNSLRQRNGWLSALRVGQRITIPTGPGASIEGWLYTVRRGDTVYSIAQRVGVNENRLKEINGIGSTVRIGQVLTIPTGETEAAAPLARGGGSAVGVSSYLLAQLIHAEAEAEPYVGKVAVGAVIMNRVVSPLFPNTLAGVMYQPHAFETVSNGRVYNNPNAESLRAARDSISGWDPTGGALYFFNPSKTSNRWIWARTIVLRIGKHVFAI